MSAVKGSPIPRTEMDALLLGRLDELADVESPNARGRSLLGIILSILVLLLISSIIVAAIVVMNPEIANMGARRRQTREAISLDEALLGTLSGNEPLLQWLPASSIQKQAPLLAGQGQQQQQQPNQLLYEEAKNIYLITMPAVDQEAASTASNQSNVAGANQRVAFPQNNMSILVPNSSLLASIDYQGFKLSPSKRFLMLWTAKRKQFRHTFTARYFIYDIQLDLISMLGTTTTTTTTGTDGETSKPALDVGRASQQPRPNHYESLDSISMYLEDGAEMGPLEARAIRGFDDERTRFQLVDWFSQPSNEDALILIQNNDLFLMGDVAATIGDGSSMGEPIRLTQTGQPDVLFNGAPDWLYEEEILAEAPALQVSPDGHWLAFLSFNDSRVDSLPFTVFGQERSGPRVRHVRYPRAGRTNPTVSVHLVDLVAARQHHSTTTNNSPPVVELVNLPQHLQQQEHYVNRLAWLANERLALIWSNRAQNRAEVVVCQPDGHSATSDPWACSSKFNWSSPTGWLDIGDDLVPLDSSHFLLLLPKFENEQVGSFKHIARVSLDRPSEFRYLTSGPWNVVSINGVDRDRHLAYFISTLEDAPDQRQAQVVSLNETKQSWPICITCEDHEQRDKCRYNQIRLSPSMSHYIFYCDGPRVPLIELRELNVSRNENNVTSVATRPLWLIEENRALRTALSATKAMPVQVRLQVPIDGTHHKANVMLLLPPLMGPTMTFRATLVAGGPYGGQDNTPGGGGGGGGGGGMTASTRMVRQARGPAFSAGQQPFNISATSESAHQDGLQRLRDYLGQLPSAGQQQYPMVVEVYAGPSSQKVDQKFGVHLGHYFASNRRTVYAMIDGRGSGFQGSRRAHELHRKLGTIEIQDQIEVTSKLTRGPLAPLVDPGKVAIWGWSYGGYAAAMALAQSNAAAMAERQRLVNGDWRSESRRSTRASENLQQAAGGGGGNGARDGEQQAPVLPPVRGVFECAASVAPVTDWTMYDTAYTEKYMSTPWADGHLDAGSPQREGAPETERAGSKLPHSSSPSRNETRFQTNQPEAQSHYDNLSSNVSRRYRQASLLEHIGAIDRKRFLLIHGTADDNVHFQQSIMLMKELIRRNIMFETRIYPDRDHSISGQAEKLHLGATLSNFFAECFDMAY